MYHVRATWVRDLLEHTPDLFTYFTEENMKISKKIMTLSVQTAVIFVCHPTTACMAVSETETHKNRYISRTSVFAIFETFARAHIHMSEAHMFMC